MRSCCKVPLQLSLLQAEQAQPFQCALKARIAAPVHLDGLCCSYSMLSVSFHVRDSQTTCSVLGAAWWVPGKGWWLDNHMPQSLVVLLLASCFQDAACHHCCRDSVCPPYSCVKFGPKRVDLFPIHFCSRQTFTTPGQFWKTTINCHHILNHKQNTMIAKRAWEEG